MSCKILGRPSKSVGADIFTITKNHYLCIIDYHSKFLVVKYVEGFSADNLIKTCRLYFHNMGYPVSDIGTNFVSEIFRNFCR